MGEMTFGPAFWALAALGLAAAAIYGLYLLQRPAGLFRALVKTAFMAAFAGALMSAHAPFPLILAVVASAIGDFLLAFDRKWMLPLGILAFLVAQLTYVVIFVAVWFFSGDNAPLWPRYAAMAAIGAAVAGFLFWFWRADLRSAPVSGALAVLALFAAGALIPWYVVFATALPRLIDDTIATVARQEGSLVLATPQILAPVLLLVSALALAVWRRDLGAVRLAAMVYAGAITLMACAAMWLPWIGWPAMIGAASFLLSDCVLSAELFRLAPDASVRRLTAPVVWWTYAAAQTLIVAGVLRIVVER